MKSVKQTSLDRLSYLFFIVVTQDNTITAHSLLPSRWPTMKSLRSLWTRDSCSARRDLDNDTRGVGQMEKDKEGIRKRSPISVFTSIVAHGDRLFFLHVACASATSHHLVLWHKVARTRRKHDSGSDSLIFSLADGMSGAAKFAIFTADFLQKWFSVS